MSLRPEAMLPPDTPAAAHERIEGRKHINARRVGLSRRLFDQFPARFGAEFPDQFTSVYMDSTGFKSQSKLVGELHGTGDIQKKAASTLLAGVILNEPLKISNEEALFLSMHRDYDNGDHSSKDAVRVLRAPHWRNPYDVFVRLGKTEYEANGRSDKIRIEDDPHPTIEQVNDLDIIISAFEDILQRFS